MGTTFLLLVAGLSRSAYAALIVVDAGGPYTVTAGSSVTLSASITSASGSCTSTSYRWDTDGDGTYDTAYSSSPSATFTASGSIYDGPATVSPVVQVYDSRCAATDTATGSVTINNADPSISGTTVTTSVNEGVSQTLVVSYTDVETGDTHSIDWDYGDGNVGTGASVSKSYDDDGTYTLTVTVTDDDGGTDSATATITVANVAPAMGTASGTSTASEGASVTRSCSATDVADDTISWAWDWGDGSTSTTASGSSSTVTHTYVDEGTGSYDVICAASDEDGGSSSSTATVTVTNAVPVASASGATSGEEGVAQTYTCSGTDAGTSDTLSYAWTFSDGTTGTGTSISKTWSDQGSYTATCTVTDNDGGAGTSAVVTTVSNVDPTLTSATAPTSGNEGTALSFVCAGTDVAADTVSVAWDFGDGDSATTGTTTHTYADDGSYTATCTASDEDGGSTSSSTSITIANVAPTIASYSFPSSGNEGQSLAFSASATDPGDDTLAYSWDFGDGNSATGTSTTHTYADNGSYTVTLTVSDGDGGTDTETHTVAVANVSPEIVTFTGDTSGDEGGTFTFDVAYTDDGSGDTLTVSWDLGDGDTEGDLDSVSHIFENDGVYTVSVTVCDDDGDCDTQTLDVVVSNADPIITSLTGDTVGTEGDSFNFVCSADDSGSLDTLTYTLTYGDGSSDSAASGTHTYVDDGVFSVGCTVEDGDGGSVTETLDVTVSNEAPTITSATSSVSGDEGESLSFAATATDPGRDTITYTWNFGDGETDTGASVTHAYADDGTYTFTLTASDEDGGSSSSTGTATVANVAPTIAVSGDTAGDEGETLTFIAEVSDPGIDDTYTCVWDWGDGETETLSGTDATHAYDEDGSYSLTLTCVDSDGGLGTASATVTVSNVAPVLTELSGDTSGDEGALYAYVCTATDQGPTDTVTITWDFGDGSTGTGESVTHTFVDEGRYAVTCTAFDDDGASVSDSLAVVVSNVAPTVDTLATDTEGSEGELLAFAGTATDPGSADVLTWTWDFGDGTTTTGDSVTHAWGDNGTWTVLLQLDDGTDVVEESFTVVTTNVAPSIDGTPDESVLTDEAYVFTPTLVDPGSLDTWIWTATLPTGATLDGSTGEVTWTPTYTDAGSYTLDLTVTDDDGESGTLSWALEVVLVDEDGDGLSDNWETEHGLDPTDPSDAAADNDGDGLSNAEEYAAGTDPSVYDGPGAPVPWSPLDGEEVAESTVALIVENAESPRGESLLYDFEVYEDEAMTVWVTAASAVAEDASGQTGWDVDVPLTENTWYWWWASASDTWVAGPWSEPVSFFYNTVNDAPGAPTPDTPFDDSSVVELQPTLVLAEAIDPDEDLLTYAISLTDAGGAAVADVTGLVGDGIHVEWTVDTVLTDGELYCWSGVATDDEGLSGPASDVACFLVDTSNLPPSVPFILSPEDTMGVNTDTVVVLVEDGIDPEGRGVAHLFELDTDPAFTSEDKQSATVESDGTGQTAWTTDTLLDDTWYYVRALCTDGASYSDPANASFYVNLDNSAPDVPALYNPEEGELIESGTAFSLTNATDPDGDAVSYDFVIFDADGAELDGGRVEEDESGTTSWTPGDLADGDYLWSARAVDEWGLASDWAAERGFAVGVPDIDTGDTGVVDTDTDPPDGEDDTGGDDPSTKDEGCGCATSTTPAGLAWLLVVLGLAGARRRDA